LAALHDLTGSNPPALCASNISWHAHADYCCTLPLLLLLLPPLLLLLLLPPLPPLLLLLLQ
jgi:hypothetical protein